jgi:hypothetical protein
MNLEITDEEATVILDGLSALPLARSYNAFNKVYKQVEERRRSNLEASQPKSVPALLSPSGLGPVPDLPP